MNTLYSFKSQALAGFVLGQILVVADSPEEARLKAVAVVQTRPDLMELGIMEDLAQAPEIVAGGVLLVSGGD